MSLSPLVLVVDDEAHILHVVGIKLEKAGFRVITAENGEEGFAMALEHQPDLIVTDDQMPFMNGLELCVALKNEAATCRIPVIMLAARKFCFNTEYGDYTNIVSLLAKPFSPRELLSQIQSAIDDQLDAKAAFN